MIDNLWLAAVSEKPDDEDGQSLHSGIYVNIGDLHNRFTSAHPLSEQVSVCIH